MKDYTRRILPVADISPARRITALVPGIVLLIAIGWLGFDLEMSDRVVLFRYMAMALAGTMAFITPHLLFPDNDKTLVQQLNLSPRHLFLHHLARLRPLWLFSVAALFIVSFGDLLQPDAHFEEKTRLFGTGIIAFTAIIMYALYRFVTIGDRSQRWSEGKAGKKMLDSFDSVGKTTSVQAGMYPTFISTILVTFAGMMVVVASAAIPHSGLGVIPYLMFAVYAGYRLTQEVRRYDRLYYQSDAFYDELFTNPQTGLRESRQPVTYNAVYWVPHRWRGAVWSQLVQLDRKRPIGRIIALLTFTYWLLIWLGVPDSWLAGWIVFWILSKNMLAWPTSRRRISPPVLHWWLMPPRDWVIARFFLQIRWTLTLILTVGVAAVFSESVGWTDVWFWTLFDLVISAITAWLLTRSNEYAFKKRYV